MKAVKPGRKNRVSKSLWHRFNRLVRYNHISNCICIKERTLRASNTFQPLTTSALVPKWVQNVDTSNDLSPRQKAEKRELLWGKGSTENRQGRGKGKDTEGPCSWENKEREHKTASLIVKSHQFRSWSLLSSLQTGWCEGSANKTSHVCLCLCTNSRVCVHSEDS